MEEECWWKKSIPLKILENQKIKQGFNKLYEVKVTGKFKLMTVKKSNLKWTINEYNKAEKILSHESNKEDWKMIDKMIAFSDP